jgi:hypothetical protein
VAAHLRRNITADAYARIQLGMTQEEVEGILGVPPGDYAWGEWLKNDTLVSADFKSSNDRLRYELWHGSGVRIAIGFDQQSKVVSKTYWIERRETIWQYLRRMVPL